MKTINALIIFLAVILTGCVTRLTDFTLITTKNVELGRMSEYQKGIKRVSGEDIAYIILIIPTGVANLKEAIDRAIESVPGCVALSDGVIYRKYGWFIIVSYSGYLVEGTPLIDPKVLSSLPSKYILVSYDRNHDKYVPHYLTKEEYEKIKRNTKN